MRRFIFATLAAAGVFAAPVGTHAAQGPMSPVPGTQASGLLQLAQSRSCNYCRRDCYGTYRIQCGYADHCRRQFSLCMRACWEDVCR